MTAELFLIKSSVGYKRMKMTDEGFIFEIRKGRINALKDLMDLYLPLVSRTSYRIMCDRSDSEHITRAVFLSLWRNPESCFSPASIRTHLLKMTCRHCRWRLLRRRILSLISVNPDIYVIHSPQAASADEYAARQAWEIFCRASRNCSDRQRVIYTLCELEGISMKQVLSAGIMLDIAVGDSLEAARQAVKVELDHFGRMNDYNAYVSFLRKVEDQLTDKVKLQRDILSIIE